MKLITELVEDVQLISEAKESGGKDYYIEGIFLQADIKNRNGRIYPLKVLEKEVNRYVVEKVNKKLAYGELNHPGSATINLDRASHIITELKKDGSNFIGKAKIMNTPMGNIARGIMESGGQLGVSSRALGTLKEERGIMVVQDDLRIATAADIVADPSAPDAFVNGIMEGVEWIYDPIKDTWLEQRLEDTKKMVHGLSKSQLEEQKLAIFSNYLAALAVKTKLL